MVNLVPSRACEGGTCPRCGGSVLSLDRGELAYVRSVTAEAP